MSYTITAAELFNSAETAARHAGVASSILSKLTYSDPAEHSAKVAECQKLIRSLQDEADRRKPSACVGGLAGKLATADSEWKQTITNVSRYFSTAAGHIYRRETKLALAHAANAVAAGEEPAPADEIAAIELVANFVMPVTIPFIGVKRGNFVVEWECARERFRRLSEARHKRAQLAGEAARQLAELRAALAAAGIDVEGLDVA